MVAAREAKGTQRWLHQQIVQWQSMEELSSSSDSWDLVQDFRDRPDRVGVPYFFKGGGASSSTRGGGLLQGGGASSRGGGFFKGKLL